MCLFDVIFWLVPGIIGGLSIVTGLYVANKSIGRESLFRIFIAWALGTSFAGVIGFTVRAALAIVIVLLSGDHRMGSFVDILPMIVGLAVTGLVMGGIGGQVMANTLHSTQLNGDDVAT